MCVLLVDGDPCRFVKGAFESGGPKALLSGGLVECVAGVMRLRVLGGAGDVVWLKL